MCNVWPYCHCSIYKSFNKLNASYPYLLYPTPGELSMMNRTDGWTKWWSKHAVLLVGYDTSSG